MLSWARDFAASLLFCAGHYIADAKHMQREYECVFSNDDERGDCGLRGRRVCGRGRPGRRGGSSPLRGGIGGAAGPTAIRGFSDRLGAAARHSRRGPARGTPQTLLFSLTPDLTHRSLSEFLQSRPQVPVYLPGDVQKNPLLLLADPDVDQGVEILVGLDEPGHEGPSLFR